MSTCTMKMGAVQHVSFVDNVSNIIVYRTKRVNLDTCTIKICTVQYSTCQKNLYDTC